MAAKRPGEGPSQSLGSRSFSLPSIPRLIMTDGASLHGDCSRCIGLCCVALAFDRGGAFAFDKAAGIPCRHLDDTYACTIHKRLEREGLSGCATYDCRGAGQLVTEMFAGHSWRDSPAVARQMFAVFAKLREIQLLRSILAHCRISAPSLDPPGGWTLEALLVLDPSALRRECADRLASGADAPMLSAIGGCGVLG